MQTALRPMIRFCVAAFGLAFLMGLSGSVTGESPYSRMPSYCLLHPPRSEGHCTIAIEGYFFDPRTNNCERYEVGGCRSIPGQSFGSREDCLATCVYKTRSMQELNMS